MGRIRWLTADVGEALDCRIDGGIGRRRLRAACPARAGSSRLGTGTAPWWSLGSRSWVLVATTVEASDESSLPRGLRCSPVVPVRPRPPRQAISTRSHSLRRHTSSRASRAARRSDGSRKSGHRSQACGHGTAGGSRPSRYRPNSGSRPAGSARRKARPRTRRPDGSTMTPAPSCSHAPHTKAP